MPHIKKTLTMFLVSAMLGGGAWYLNTTGTIGGVASSFLGSTTTFSCTEKSLSKQKSTYKKIVTRHKKALAIKKKLEAEITALKVSDPQGQLTKKEEILRTLTRQINVYYRFIRKYETCKTEIKFNPTVGTGVMSGEAQVVVSTKEYHALAAFEITSPAGLNTYIQSLQFKVDVLPNMGVVVDKWFLLHDGANPILCQANTGNNLVNCELSGDMPVDIMSSMRRTYALGAYITALHGSGTVDIQVSRIAFNDGRETTGGIVESPLLSFGVVEPIVQPVARPVVETPPTILVNEEVGAAEDETVTESTEPVNTVSEESSDEDSQVATPEDSDTSDEQVVSDEDGAEEQAQDTVSEIETTPNTDTDQGDQDIQTQDENSTSDDVGSGVNATANASDVSSEGSSEETTGDTPPPSENTPEV